MLHPHGRGRGNKPGSRVLLTHLLGNLRSPLVSGVGIVPQRLLISREHLKRFLSLSHLCRERASFAESIIPPDCPSSAYTQGNAR
jgi:hypothetical protein